MIGVAPLVVTCADVAATRAVAAAVVGHIRAGDTLLLIGDLGSGKTAFTQGLAAAAGVTETVTSPTFTLMRPYPTALGLDLLHVDVYRLETTAEIAGLGLGELLDEDAFAVIEWGERAVPVIGEHHLEIRITQSGTGDERRLQLRGSGRSWPPRWDVLVADVTEAAGNAGEPARSWP